MCIHKKNSTPPQNIPFPGLNWKVGKMNYHLGKMRPQLGNMFEKWQNFSRSGQKNLFMTKRMIDAVTCTELSAAAVGAPSQSAEGLRGCLGTMRQEPSCLTIAEEKPNISLNAEQTLSQTNLTDLTSAPIRKEPNKPKVGKRFAERKHLVPNCCLTRSSKRQSNQECTVKILINDYDCSKSFFYHRAVG